MGKPVRTTITTTFETTDLGNGNYEIKELAPEDSEESAFPDLHGANRKQFEVPIPFAPLSIVGYYDVEDKEIGVYTTMSGAQIGPKYTAGVDSGINFDVNFLAFRGGVGIFKAGNKLKARFNFSSFWGDDKKAEVDLLTI